MFIVFFLSTTLSIFVIMYFGLLFSVTAGWHEGHSRSSSPC